MRPRDHVAELGTIASIWAHPDDESYVAGGLMAAAVANGQRVVCLSATAGEHGTDNPAAWPPERLGRLRRWEAGAAMAVLGIDDHRFLDLPDGGLANLDPAGPVVRIADVLREVGPDTILTFGPDGGTFHPDHQTVCRWTSAAWEQAGRPGRILHAAMAASHLEAWADRYEGWGLYMSDERPTGVPDGDLAVDLHLEEDEGLLDQKVAALLAMQSQTASAVALLGEADYRASNARESYVLAAGG
jgi:LmbE family N-acetylglucosaminyl deacetylase